MVQQNFALWRRDALAWTLRDAGAQSSPHEWEARFANYANLVKWPGASQALAVWFRGPDGMMGVEDSSSLGRIKGGFPACAWLRAASRVGLSPDSVPGGKEAASQTGYRFCYADGMHGLGETFLTAVALQPGRCGCVHDHRAASSSTCSCHDAGLELLTYNSSTP